MNENSMNDRLAQIERKEAAEQALCRAADDYVWNPTPETMEALRLARGEWQTAVGLWKLSVLDDREET